jgi:hypothetical protein
VLENKAFIFALSGECFPYFTEDGKQLLKNICYWLAGREIVGTESQSSSDQVSVYPSPSSGIVRMKLDQTASSLAVKVFGIEGRVLFSEQYSNTAYEVLDLSGLHPGIYFIRLEGPDISFTKRIIIK